MLRDDGLLAIHRINRLQLVDILLLTPGGWLRHGTEAEFNAGETLLAQVLRPVQEINREDDKAIRKVWNDMKNSLTKPQ